MCLVENMIMNKTLYILLFVSFSFCETVTEFDVEAFLKNNFLAGNLPRQEPTRYNPLEGETHSSCTVANRSGVCMYTAECVNAGGTPLGTCREGYSFGSCCFTPSHVSALIKVDVGDGGELKPVKYGNHNCGTVSKLFVRRGHIYNGEEAQFGEFPWQVSIRRVAVRQKTVPWCGGAILNHEWVITAAHCFYRVRAANIIVRFGELNFKKPNKYFPYVERRVKQNIWHPKYVKAKGAISDYDIALLRIEKPIRFQPHISPICLPGPENIVPGDRPITTGWGKTENLKLSSVLKKIVAPVLSNALCQKLFMKEGYTLKLSNKVFCAGYPDGVQDACQGDSGGPLQMKGKDGRFYLAGIVSTGIGCAKPNFPGLYLRVSPYLHWILETISIEERNKKLDN